jgi:hypothetical protein
MRNWWYSRVMFKTRPVETQRMTFLRDRGYTADSRHPNASLEPLKEKLLSFGGQAVVLHSDEPHLHDEEPHLQQIIERGYIEDGANPLLARGAQSACHYNAYRLWLAQPEKTILCTGYALSDDGVWRQHSWAKYNGRIVETTVPRVAYFGFELTAEESEAFM